MYPLVEHSCEFLGPVIVHNLCQGIFGHQVHTSAFWILQEEAQNCKLGNRGFSRASRCTDKNVVVTVENSIEHLRLDWVELLEFVGVECLQSGVAQSCDGQWLQIEQLCRRRIFLGQDQMPERHWKLGLSTCNSFAIKIYYFA